MGTGPEGGTETSQAGAAAALAGRARSPRETGDSPLLGPTWVGVTDNGACPVPAWPCSGLPKDTRPSDFCP